MATLKSGEDLPEEDHFSRYCKPTTVDHGKVMSAAFIPKVKEDYLSINWIEYFSDDKNIAIDNIRQSFEDKGYTLRPNGRFAVLSIEKVYDTVLNVTEKTLRFLYLPEDDDLSHSGILDYTYEEIDVSLAIHSVLITHDIYPALK